MRFGNDEPAVSPVIGVMLMIVVTIIIAAIVSAFAGGYATADKKAPHAVISCRYMPPAGSTSSYSAGTVQSGTPVAIPNGGLLFTHESGDYINLLNTYVVISSGDASRRFDFTALQKANSKQHDEALYYGGIVNFIDYDREINAGNQFALAGENSGSTGPAGAYLGWSSGSALYLTANQTATFTLVDRESGQTISSGRIQYDG